MSGQDWLVKSDMKFEQYDKWYFFIIGTIWYIVLYDKTISNNSKKKETSNIETYSILQ